jgi:hypothetical protein
MESGRRSKHSSRDIVKFRGGLREVIRSDERSHMTAGGNCSTDIETDPERGCAKAHQCRHDFLPNQDRLWRRMFVSSVVCEHSPG